MGSANSRTEQQFREMVERAGDGFWEIDEHNITAYVNPAMRRIARCDAMVGLSWEDFFDSKNAHLIHQHLTRSSKLHPAAFEAQLRCRDGVNRPVLIYPASDSDTSQKRWRGGYLLVTDLTKVKKSEAEIRRRNAELATLNRLSLSLNETFDLDVIGRTVLEEIHVYLELNFAALYLREKDLFRLRNLVYSGDSDRELLKELSSDTSWLEEIHGKRYPLALSNLQSRSLDIGSHADKPLSWIVAPLFRGEDLIGVILGGRQERKQFNAGELKFLFSVSNLSGVAIQNTVLFAQIYHSKVEWENTFDSLSDLVVIYDPIGTVLRVNRAFASRMGMPFHRILGKPSEELFANSSLKLNCFPTHGIEEALPIFSELEDPVKGEVFLISCTPIRDHSGGFFGMVQVARNVTAERHLREQLIQREKLSALGELVSGVAHELNNPLTGVLGYAQLLISRSPTGDSAPPELKHIVREAERAGKIVQNLLAFARKQHTERTTVDLNKLLEETLELFSYDMKHSRITVKPSFDRRLPSVLGDRGQLQQVCVNLISNALQAIAEAHRPGVLSIRTWIDGAWAKFEIEDNGVGIAKENLLKVFDPFYTTKPAGKGTGLGLSISFGVIQSHGGELSLHSEQGAGSRFFVSLPLGGRPEPVLARPLFSSPASLRPPRTILVIDDDTVILSLVEKVLVDEGHSVDMASSGKVALELLKAREYDVIVTDIRLPELSGIEVFRRLQTLGAKQANKVLFLTGDMLNPQTCDFLEKSGRPYLTKPFSIQDFLQAVASIPKQE